MTAALPTCPHRPPCPGCPHYGRPGIAPEAWRRLVQMADAAGLRAPPLQEGAPLGFRRRARLMVRGRARSPKVGIFQQGSHRIVDIPECRIHHPLVNVVAAALKRALRSTGVAPYADRPHRGELRAVQIVVEREGRRAQVVLVGNAASSSPLLALAASLERELGPALQGLWWNGNPERGNAILGPLWEHLAGEAELRERVGRIDVFFPPGAFGQSHPALAERLVERVQAWVPAGGVVAELYAGCGPVGLGLLERCRELRFNEANPHALEGLARGIAVRPAAERARARLAPGDAAERLEILAGADSVVVDPPRRGLDLPVLEELASRPPGRLVYVSCGLDAFARDASRLLEGGLALRALEVFACFPYTRHVETAALFERRRPSHAGV